MAPSTGGACRVHEVAEYAPHLITSLSRVGSSLWKYGSRYGPILEKMYAQMEQRQRERQDEMRAAAAQGTILEKVKQVGLSAPVCGGTLS